MTGDKTHQQQIAIIEGRVNTKNADEDFDPRPDLARAEAGLPPPPPASKSASDPDRPDDLEHRGLNQESGHDKRGG